jgi:succinate dehydrogenase / fumarate reductase cytochrome b subunit
MLSRCGAFVRSSIGRKALMALSGLLLIGFVIAHVAGNLTLYADSQGEHFDAYAQKLDDLGPLKLLAEVGLLALFTAHIALGMRTALENREARPERYKDLAPKGQRTWSSMTMIATGSVVLVFLVIHVLDFRLGMRDPKGLAAMVVQRLSAPLGAGIYLVGVTLLGVHLWHGFQSLMQTLGLRNSRYAPAIKTIGMVLALGLGAAFATFPICCFLWHGKWPWS